MSTSARAATWSFARSIRWARFQLWRWNDGSVLFDSPVICEYLNHHGGGKFFPGNNIWRQNSGRWKALVLQALGDGIMEAALALGV